MRGTFLRGRRGANILFFSLKGKHIIGAVLTALFFIIAMLFFYFKQSGFLKDEKSAAYPVREQVAKEDSVITKLNAEMLSEDVRLLDKNVNDLEDRYRQTIADVWVNYQNGPDNFFQIGDIVESLNKINVPFLYQSFHSRLVSALRMKEQALISGDLVRLQKAEREINFLENSSFL